MAPQQRLGILDPSTNNPFARSERLARPDRGPAHAVDEQAGRRGRRSRRPTRATTSSRSATDRAVSSGFSPNAPTRRASVASTRPRRCATKPHGTTGRPLRTGRVRLDLGTADRTGLPDASVDRVVSVNNVAIWPDLEAAVDELHRVVRPGGTVIIAWHGGTTPSRIARSLRLPEDELGRIEQTAAGSHRRGRSPPAQRASTYSRPFARGESRSIRFVTV